MCKFTLINKIMCKSTYIIIFHAFLSNNVKSDVNNIRLFLSFQTRIKFHANFCEVGSLRPNIVTNYSVIMAKNKMLKYINT